MKPIFYTTNCPACNVLKKMLDKKQLEYTVVSDVELMLSKGITSAPALEIDEQIMNYKQAYEWAKNL